MSQPFPLDPFFSGNYAPISFEADAFDLPPRGELPKELAGTLYRNGPNPQFAPRDPHHHWFIGDGMIHAFDQFDTLAHLDLKTNKRTAYKLPNGDAVSEPIFIPRDVDAREEDGYLPATIYRG
jgi:carotenoid cleavage dioxygenase-like enzyme